MGNTIFTRMYTKKTGPSYGTKVCCRNMNFFSRHEKVTFRMFLSSSNFISWIQSEARHVSIHFSQIFIIPTQQIYYIHNLDMMLTISIPMEIPSWGGDPNYLAGRNSQLWISRAIMIAAPDFVHNLAPWSFGVRILKLSWTWRPHLRSQKPAYIAMVFDRD